jgi:hypothetical protein
MFADQKEQRTNIQHADCNGFTDPEEPKWQSAT